jgi:P-type Ca2+ transporter type 2C
VTGEARAQQGTWHGLDLEEVEHTLGTSLGTGLSGEDAVRRLTEFGPNELEAGEGTSPWSLLLDQLKNVLIVILLIAVVLSAVLGHATEARSSL